MYGLDLAAYFVGGGFLANAAPHFICGVTGRPFQTPFAQPSGEGLSSSTLNVLWAFFNLACAYVLLGRVGDFTLARLSDVLASALGALLMSLFAARHFGRFHGGNISENL